MNFLTHILAAIGRTVLGALAALGRISIFAGQTLGHMARPPIYLKEIGHSLMSVGYFSLPVVGLTALFTGGALALQIYSGGPRSSPSAWCANLAPSLSV